MGKTTKGTQAAASPEAVRTARRDGSSGGNGTPQNRPTAPPTGPAPLVGDPDFLPQHTFISVPLLGDNGFIQNALNFHNNSGLNPHTVGSIEQILDLLANPAQTGTGLLDRIRIVSHFFVADPGDPEKPANMGINFLQGGGRGALLQHFDGFAESSIAGLRAVISFDLTGPPLRTTHLFFISDTGLVLTALRSAGHGTLVDELPVDSLGEIADDDIEEFILICASKWVLDKQPIISRPECLTDQHQAYDVVLSHLHSEVSGGSSPVFPGPRLDALKTAILALASIPGANFPTGLTTAFLDRHCANVSAGLTGFAGDSFRNKILAVRPRFDHFTTIDIRGCRAGTDLGYLAAIQRFFGRSEAVRPVITAPDWFQRFNQIAEIAPFGTTPQAQAAAINGLHNNGFPPTYSAGNVRSQFADWTNGFGVDPTHLTFWHNTFQLDVLEFSKLQWRTAIPNRKVTISRLDALTTADFANIFNMLGEFFFVRNSRRPAAAQIGIMTPLLSNLNTWTNQLNADIPVGSSASDLATRFNNFRTIYEAVESRMDNPAFHNSPQRVIPAAQPVGLSVAGATALRNNLRTFINTNNNSRFASVHDFLTAADALTQDDPALMRYFLGLALPFQLAHISNVNFDAQRLVTFQDQIGPAESRRQHEAIRHWIRASWRGVSAPNIPNTVDYDSGRHSSWVVEGRNQGPSAICPHSSFMNHMITQPA